MVQTKSHTVTILNALALFVVLISGSCGGKKESGVDAADSIRIEFEPNDSNVVADSVAIEDYTTYCCSNHTPVHCGVTSELENLTKTHGCTDFRTP